MEWFQADGDVAFLFPSSHFFVLVAHFLSLHLLFFFLMMQPVSSFFSFVNSRLAFCDCTCQPLTEFFVITFLRNLCIVASSSVRGV